MDQRPLTPAERKTLADLPGSHTPSQLIRHIGMESFGASICLGGIFIIAALALLGSMRAHPTVITIIVATIGVFSTIVAGISTALRYSIARRKEVHARAKIDADLAGGVVAVERHRATAALRAVMSETRERAYFLRLADGSTMFVGFWSPPEHDNPADIHDLPLHLDAYPMAEVELARGPGSRILLSVTFSGATLPVAATFEHRQENDAPFVDVGRIAPVPWEDVQKTYGVISPSGSSSTS